MSNEPGITIPGSFNIYDSYVTDPHYARLLTAGWSGALGLFVLWNLPKAIRNLSVLDGHVLREVTFQPLATKSTENDKPAFPPAAGTRFNWKQPKLRYGPLWSFLSRPLPLPLSSSSSTRRRYTSLNIGQSLLLLLIPILVLSTLLPQQQLYTNPNRLTFLALALFVPLFLFASKACLPLTLLTNKSYIDFNFIHRWIGRAIFVMGLAHGSLWLADYSRYGQLKAQLQTSKVQYGIATLTFLFLLQLSSIPYIRKHYYHVFFTMHVMGFVGVLVLVNYHTPYALPWIAYGVAVVYGIDLGLRWLVKTRLTMVTVTPHGDGLTQVWVHHVNSGWKAGQHVQMRLLHTPRTDKETSKWSPASLLPTLRSLESHPYTIAAAPSAQSSGFPMYIRSAGQHTWSQGVQTLLPGSTHWAILEGPYGESCSEEIASGFESALFVAGGSGATWVIAIVQGIIAACASKTHGLTKCSIAWFVQDAKHASWLAQEWQSIIEHGRQAGLDIEVNIYATRSEGIDIKLPLGCRFASLPTDDGRLRIASLVGAMIEDAVNPCRICDVCTCSSNPDNDGCCPQDSEACCSTTPVLTRFQDVDDIVVVGEKSCCSMEGSQNSCEKEKSDVAVKCCGKCQSSQARVVEEPKRIRSHGLAIGVCGPASMQTEARITVASLSQATQKRIGGVRLYSEAFSL